MKKCMVKNSVYKICALLLILFFSARATVQPIFPGENLWKLVSRIGLTSDIIEEKVCDLACDTCDTDIKQDDIPFTITVPGVYCLAENVNFTTGSAVTINSNCVVFDLLGHAIEGDGVDMNSIGIRVVDVLNTFTANVTVKNGIIKKAGSSQVSVSARGPVRIRNMQLIGGPNSCGLLLSGDSKKVFVDDCVACNCENGFLLAGSFCIFKNCVAINNDNGFLIPGDNNCLFKCKASDNNVGNGFKIEGVKNILRKCTATSNAENGFRLDGGGNNQIIGCSAICNNEFGIDDKGDQSIIHNNVANVNGTNYSTEVDLIVTTVTVNTGFWANISC